MYKRLCTYHRPRNMNKLVVGKQGYMIDFSIDNYGYNKATTVIRLWWFYVHEVVGRREVPLLTRICTAVE